MGRVGEMDDQDFVTRTSGIENFDCVSLTLASRRRKVGLPLAVTSRGKKVGFASVETDRPFNRHFQKKESRPPFASDESTLWLSLSGKEGRPLHFHRCCNCRRWIDPLAFAFMGREVGLTWSQTDRPFGRHFPGKESRPRFASDSLPRWTITTSWASLLGEGHSDSLRLRWIAPSDSRSSGKASQPPSASDGSSR